jgi:hypothetical protein
MPTPAPVDLDAISCEVAQHRLQMLAEEGGFRTSRSAGSPFVLGLGSCASAIFERNGEIIAQTLGGMMHVSAVREMMRAVIEGASSEPGPSQNLRDTHDDRHFDFQRDWDRRRMGQARPSNSYGIGIASSQIL